MIDLLEVNDKYEVRYNDALLSIKEFVTLIRRNKGCPGDADGRKKYQVCKELSYIFWMNSTKSPGILAGKTGLELHKDAIINIGLPEDWESDNIIDAAAIKYKELTQSTNLSHRLYRSLLSSFNSSDKLINKIRENLDLALSGDISKEEVSTLVSLQTKLLDMATQIPIKLRELRNAEELLLQDLKDVEVGRGGVLITNSMKRPEER